MTFVVKYVWSLIISHIKDSFKVFPNPMCRLRPYACIDCQPYFVSYTHVHVAKTSFRICSMACSTMGLWQQMECYQPCPQTRELISLFSSCYSQKNFLFYICLYILHKKISFHPFSRRFQFSSVTIDYIHSLYQFLPHLYINPYRLSTFILSGMHAVPLYILQLSNQS